VFCKRTIFGTGPYPGGQKYGNVAIDISSRPSVVVAAFSTSAVHVTSAEGGLHILFSGSNTHLFVPATGAADAPDVIVGQLLLVIV